MFYYVVHLKYLCFILANKSKSYQRKKYYAVGTLRIVFRMSMIYLSLKYKIIIVIL